MHICLCMKIYMNSKTQVWRDTCFNVKAFVSGERLGGYGCLGYCVVFCGCPFLGPAHFTQLREMLPIAGLYRVPLQTVPSAARSYLAKPKFLPGDRLPPMTGSYVVKCMCPLLQFGTVMKGNPSFRAPLRDGCNLCCNLQLLGNLFSLGFILLLSSPPRCFWEYFPITCTQVSFRVYILGYSAYNNGQYIIDWWRVGGFFFFSSHFALLLKLE